MAGYSVVPHGDVENGTFSSSDPLEIPRRSNGGCTLLVDRSETSRIGPVRLDLSFRRLRFSVSGGATQVLITVRAQNRAPMIFSASILLESHCEFKHLFS